MAHLHLRNFNNKKNKPTCFLEGIGSKVKTVAQIAGSIKQIYDIGRDLAPVLTTAAAVLL